MKKISTIFVCSKGKPNASRIMKWFKEYKFTKYVFIISPEDSEKQYKEFVGPNVIKAPKFVNSLYKKKEWITRTANEGEWVFIVDDNINQVTGTTKERPIKEDYDNPLSPQHVLAIVNEDIKLAEKIGAVHGGYASNSNHFFRVKHYREVGFVWGKMCYFKNCRMVWDHSQQQMEDYVHTATCLKFSGRVLINNFLYADATRNEGIGGSLSYEKRVPAKKKATKYLVEKFNGLFKVNDRPGLVEGTEVRMRFTSIKQIDLWRMKFKNSNSYVRT